MSPVAKKENAVPLAARDTRPASDPLHDAADALLRASLEGCRQHERVARLAGIACADDELRDAAAACELADRHLAARTKGYEVQAAVGKGKTHDDFWRAANTLWHASHEYARRHHACDSLTTKLSKHSSDKLGALTLEYELEASSLLALRQAIASYRKFRPSAAE